MMCACTARVRAHRVSVHDVYKHTEGISLLCGGVEGKRVVDEDVVGYGVGGAEAEEVHTGEIGETVCAHVTEPSCATSSTQ